MSAMFRSLSIRNYRIWFVGALVSNIGAWMQATAQNWVVLTELSDTDAIAVGITMALQFGPQLVLVPFSGVVADRFDRRRVLMVTQSLLMLLALGLGWATRSMSFLRRHIRAINIAGGVVLVVLGLLMVSGLWTRLMSSLQGVMANVQLPL